MGRIIRGEPTMKKSEIKKLRKQYPEKDYNIKESQGSLIVSPKKETIRMYPKHREILSKNGAGTEAVSKELEKYLDKSALSSKDFELVQVSVKKTTAKQLKNLATICHTRKIIFIQKLLEGKTRKILEGK